MVRPGRPPPDARVGRHQGVTAEVEVALGRASLAACSTATALILRSETTAPALLRQPGLVERRGPRRPSSSAAVARICARVTTPVPPIPVIRVGDAPGGRRAGDPGGIGKAAASRAGAARPRRTASVRAPR